MRIFVMLLLLLSIPAIAFADILDVPAVYPTIQEAVNVAQNGDTVQVAVGDYVGQVTVDGKSIEIKGAGISVTRIIPPQTLDVTFTTASPNKCVVGVINNANLTLRNLTIDGFYRGNGNYRFIGIGFRNAGGLMSYCTVKKIQESPFNGNQHGVAVYGFNDDGTDRTITVRNCNFSLYQKAGIALNGANIIADVDNCLVLGQGATGAIAQTGIQIGYGARGTIQESLSVGNVYTGPSATAAGILLYDADTVDVLNCPNIKDNQMGTYYITTSGNFVNNVTSAGAVAQGSGGYYYGLAIDDQGVHGPEAEVFGDGVKSLGGRSTTTVVVAGSTFTAATAGHGSGVGAWAQNGDNVVADVIGCNISGWEWGVEVYDDGTAMASVSVYQSTLSGNTAYGLVNYTSNPVDARYNGWGDATGPYHPILNPTGQGDAVSDTVDFIPWLTGDESLTAEAYTFAAHEGGNIDFSLDAGAANANRDYIILGNATGTEPGLDFSPSVHLPLNWDPVTDLLLALVNTPALYHFKYQLDGIGQSTAHLDTLGAVPPTAIGATLNFAFLLYLPFVDYASNAVSLRILP